MHGLNKSNLSSLAQLFAKLQRGLQNFLDDPRVPELSIVRMTISHTVCISFSDQESTNSICLNRLYIIPLN